MEARRAQRLNELRVDREAFAIFGIRERGFQEARPPDEYAMPAVTALPRAEDRWSGREDLNLRPLRPERSALPGCATPRHLVSNLARV
jgi:hypothetical protein